MTCAVANALGSALAGAPSDWGLSHMIQLSPDLWEVILTDGDEVAVSTGTTPTAAIASAIDKVYRSDVSRRSAFGTARPAPGTIAEIIGLYTRPAVLIPRR